MLSIPFLILLLILLELLPSSCIAISITTFSSDSPIDPSLFGKPAVTPAPLSDLLPNVHPRLVFNSAQWSKILKSYALNQETPGTWAYHQRQYSFQKGPNSDFVAYLSNLDVSAYTGHTQDLTVTTNLQRAKLKTLADEAVKMNEAQSHQLFVCAMWAQVDEHIPDVSHRTIPSNFLNKCINATTNWATVLLAHRVYTCASECPEGNSGTRAIIWNLKERYNVQNDWYTGGLSLALVYDVLYGILTNTQRRVIRSALALLVMHKNSWGNTLNSTRDSPNAQKHPHRIFSNWASYHSNLYLANLAIEGDTDFDITTTAVLSASGSAGFNPGLNSRFVAMLEAFMEHGVYPDGSTLEDGYTYFYALREGSLGFLAATRRGSHIIDSQRFRNLIHNLVQIVEPWHCGQLLGGASGGGLAYPVYTALFRYAYPKGVLPLMMWRHRFGHSFINNNPCRIDWHQNIIQISILAGEHDSDVTDAISPEGLSGGDKALLPRAFYTPRRGLLFMRDGWWEHAALVHFDARPDAFFVGHDNADRGVFSYTAMKQTWLIDLPDWRNNIDSRKHSLLHIDGLAMDEKAPSVDMLKTIMKRGTYFAAANLTYAYNVQWARAWPDANPPKNYILTYGPNGDTRRVPTLLIEKEFGDPRDFGWPKGDLGEDIGFERPESNLWGDPDVGFMGMYTWKRNYREIPLQHIIRSVALVPGAESRPGFALVADSVAVGDDKIHKYDAYYIINDKVLVDKKNSKCIGSTCMIELVTDDGKKRADFIVVASSNISLILKVEEFETEAVHKRVVVTGMTKGNLQIWTAICARVGDERRKMKLEMVSKAVAQVTYAGKASLFKLERKKHTMVPMYFVSKSPAPTPSSQEVEKEPMPISKLRTNKFLSLSEEIFSYDFRVFYDRTTTMTYQKVLLLKTGKSRTRNGFQSYEQISTCHHQTLQLSETYMKLYYCGTDKVSKRNYKARNCREIWMDEDMSKTCGLDGLATGMVQVYRRGQLRPKRMYYVVLSASRMAAPKPITVMIKHTRKWIEV